MKIVIIFIMLTLKLIASSDIVGVWQSTKDTLSCLCGHKTQILIKAGDRPGEFKVTCYIVGHSKIASIGSIEYDGDLITSQELKFVAKIQVNKTKDRLALRDTSNKYPWIYFTKIQQEKFDAKIKSMTFTEAKDKSGLRPFSFFIEKKTKE